VQNFSATKKILTGCKKPVNFLVMLKKSGDQAVKLSNDLGQSLRLRRKELGMTLQAVADAAGLTAGFISQVERGLTAPSLASLVSVSEVLRTPLSVFLKQPKQSEAATHKASRTAYSITGAGVSYERLSTTFTSSQLHSVIVHEPPGFRGEPISHRGEEMFYIIDGEITVEIEGDVEILRKGDSIHFDSSRVHSTWNHGSTTASVLWCGTMDVFGDAPAPIHKIASTDGAQNQSKGEKKT
jgi:transcriptional regulator with XRE-family HTH domain